MKDSFSFIPASAKMARIMTSLLFAILCLLFSEIASALPQADDCTLRFTGSYRATIKLRKSGLSYQRYNNGKPVTLNEWFKLTKRLSQGLGTSGSSIPKDQIIKNAEDIQVTLKGFLLLVGFERHRKKGDGKDNEFHIEIGATREWNGPHAIVEVSTGKTSCSARKKAWSLALADALSDADKKSHKPPTILRKFWNPPEVLVTGYVFIDGAHAHKNMTPQDWAESDGGRGIRFEGLPSQVKGLFEIHPVTSLTKTGG
jgi:hypothetical protein